MKISIIIKCINLIFILIFSRTVYASDDLKELKTIFRSCSDHGNLIKTLQVNITFTHYNSRFSFPTKSTYELLYRRKDKHWKAKYNREAWKSEEEIEKYKGYHEQIDDVYFDFQSNIKAGVIENKYQEGFAGLIIYGIMGIEGFSYKYEDILDEIENNEIEIKSIKHSQYNGLESINVSITKQNMKFDLIIVPAWQYSIPYYETKIQDDNVNIKITNIVEYSKDNISGIWFPKKHIKTFYHGDKINWEKEVVYSNLKINDFISDSMIAFPIPKGTNIQNALTNEVYILKDKATLKDILSGKVKSVQQQYASQSNDLELKIWWKFVKMSIILRILTIIMFTIAIYFALSMIKKKFFQPN
jgi:hypothetical protein